MLKICKVCKVREKKQQQNTQHQKRYWCICKMKQQQPQYILDSKLAQKNKLSTTGRQLLYDCEPRKMMMVINLWVIVLLLYACDTCFSV